MRHEWIEGPDDLGYTWFMIRDLRTGYTHRRPVDLMWMRAGGLATDAAEDWNWRQARRDFQANLGIVHVLLARNAETGHVQAELHGGPKDGLHLEVPANAQGGPAEHTWIAFELHRLPELHNATVGSPDWPTPCLTYEADPFPDLTTRLWPFRYKGNR
jgi:hypothetical protein